MANAATIRSAFRRLHLGDAIAPVLKSNCQRWRFFWKFHRKQPMVDAVRVVQMSPPGRANALAAWVSAENWAVIRGSIRPHHGGSLLWEVLVAHPIDVFEISQVHVLLRNPEVRSALARAAAGSAARVARVWRVEGIDLTVTEDLDFQLLRLCVVISDSDAG